MDSILRNMIDNNIDTKFLKSYTDMDDLFEHVNKIHLSYDYCLFFFEGSYFLCIYEFDSVWIYLINSDYIISQEKSNYSKKIIMSLYDVYYVIIHADDDFYVESFNGNENIQAMNYYKFVCVD